MPHKAEIIEIKQLADTALAFCCRCCQDLASDSWHTVYLEPQMTDAEIDAASSKNILSGGGIDAASFPMYRDGGGIEAEIERHRERVEAKHQAMQQTKALLEKLKSKGAGS